MPRKFFKRFLPDSQWIKQHQSLQMLGDWLHDPNLWHLNRHSAAAGIFIGLFVAFIPIPAQMPLAALIAILARANLPLSVLMVWTSNPLTMPPLFYMAYKIGAAVMSVKTQPFNFELSLDWLMTGIAHIWQPFLLGCLICGLFFGLLGSTVVRWLWRRVTIKRWHDRRLQRQQKKAAATKQTV